MHRLTEAVNNLIKQIDTLDHHTEHKFVDVYDHIKTIVGKLAHKEEDSEERIALLETLVQKVKRQFNQFRAIFLLPHTYIYTYIHAYIHTYQSRRWVRVYTPACPASSPRCTVL